VDFSGTLGLSWNSPQILIRISNVNFAVKACLNQTPNGLARLCVFFVKLIYSHKFIQVHFIVDSFFGGGEVELALIFNHLLGTARNIELLMFRSLLFLLFRIGCLCLSKSLTLRVLACKECGKSLLVLRQLCSTKEVLHALNAYTLSWIVLSTNSCHTLDEGCFRTKWPQDEQSDLYRATYVQTPHERWVRNDANHISSVVVLLFQLPQPMEGCIGLNFEEHTLLIAGLIICEFSVCKISLTKDDNRSRPSRCNDSRLCVVDRRQNFVEHLDPFDIGCLEVVFDAKFENFDVMHV
jgi:hypothetical protein